MMKDKIKVALILCGILLLGLIVGYVWAVNTGKVLDNKKVAFRVELKKEDVDYDMKAMLSYLKCRYEKDGFKVADFAYAGDLYPKRLDNAGINVFVRGLAISLDKRINEDAYNIYLTSKFVGGHIEEFRNFDEYMTVQKGLMEAGKSAGLEMTYLEQGVCDIKKIDRNKATNIVYIFERNSAELSGVVSNFSNLEKYNAIEFAKLSEEEKEEVFKRAKVVIYIVENDFIMDGHYLGFAIYDVLSYGVPVITNRQSSVYGVDGLYYFYNKEDLKNLVDRFN